MYLRGRQYIAYPYYIINNLYMKGVLKYNTNNYMKKVKLIIGNSNSTNIPKSKKRISKISKGKTIISGGNGKIEESNIRYNPDEEDRFEIGERPFEIYVDTIPEECEHCIFYVRNDNKDKVTKEESVFYCLLRWLLSTAQYGGIDISIPKTYQCPLQRIEESPKFKLLRNNHLSRIRALESAVFEVDGGDDGVYG